MVDSFPGPWVDLNMNDLVQQTRIEAKIIWLQLPNPVLLPLCEILGIRSRQCRISTRDVWEQFANSCYVVSYHDRHGNDVNWDRPEARHYTLQDWVSMHGNNPSFRRSGNIIISVYDSVKEKRVIVDGIHRGALLSSWNSGQDNQFSENSVYEWYGPFVNVIFPCDLCHFYSNDASVHTV